MTRRIAIVFVAIGTVVLVGALVGGGTILLDGKDGDVSTDAALVLLIASAARAIFVGLRRLREAESSAAVTGGTPTQRSRHLSPLNDPRYRKWRVGFGVAVLMVGIAGIFGADTLGGGLFLSAMAAFALFTEFILA